MTFTRHPLLVLLATVIVLAPLGARADVSKVTIVARTPVAVRIQPRRRISATASSCARATPSCGSAGSST